MIDAEAARHYVSENLQNRMTDEYIVCEKAIKSAIEKGNYECHIYRDLMAKTIANLRNLGYKVDKRSDRNEDYIVISWHDVTK